MRRRNGLLVGLIALFSSAGSAEAADWKNLPYFSWIRGEAYLGTDGTWTGARVAPYSTPVTFSYSDIAATRNYIWSPTCGRARERRTFTKVYDLPGAPVSGEFQLAYRGGWARPVKRAVLEVNGVEVGRLGNTGGISTSGQLTPEALAAFRYGPNTITLRATKARLKRGQRCHDQSVFHYVGVLGGLVLKFGGELTVDPPQLPTEIMRNVTNGQIVSLQGQARVNNLGPAAAYSGKLIVNVSGDGETVLSTVAGLPSPPFENCVVAPVGSREMTCDFTEFLPGATATVPLLLGTRVNTAFFRNGAGRVRVAVLVTGMATISNPASQQEKFIVLCTAGATDPACR